LALYSTTNDDPLRSPCGNVAADRSQDLINYDSIAVGGTIGPSDRATALSHPDWKQPEAIK
jgi:hypothetical protein